MFWLILLAWEQSSEQAFRNWLLEILAQNKPLSTAGMISFYTFDICLHLFLKKDLIKGRLKIF